MKKLSLAFSAIMLFALCSCNYALVSVEKSDKDFISHSYSLLDGEKNYSINVDEDSVVTIESVVTEGTLSVNVKNSDKEQVYNSDLVTDTYTFNVKKGKYKITLNADNTSGDYKITWKPQ